MLLKSWITVASAATPLLLVPLAKERLGWRDTSVGCVGALSGLVSGYATAVSTSPWQLAVGQSLGIVRPAWYVATWSVVARAVEAHEQARLYALVGATEVLGPAVGGLLYAACFTFSERWWPGGAYAMSAFLGTGALGLFLSLELLERADSGH